MFRKLIIASAVLAVSSNLAYAHKNFKGEQGEPVYKGEAPCPVEVYTAGPYVGLSAGPRVNISGRPAAASELTGILSAGYGALWDQTYYLAGEIFLQDSAKLKDYTRVTGGSARDTWGAGISILPGYMLTSHVLGYLRAGWEQSHFTNANGFSSANKGGWQVGLGGQTNIVQNWDLRGEYDYTQYSRVSGVGHVLSHQFVLGLVYKFV